jgi:hypothetical protein
VSRAADGRDGGDSAASGRRQDEAMSSGHPTDDERTILHHIDELVAEEKQLRAAHHGLDSQSRERLRTIEAQLDQAWDLLRRRRAQAEFGGDPDAVSERPVGEVEGYLQ